MTAAHFNSNKFGLRFGAGSKSALGLFKVSHNEKWSSPPRISSVDVTSPFGQCLRWWEPLTTVPDRNMTQRLVSVNLFAKTAHHHGHHVVTKIINGFAVMFLGYFVLSLKVSSMYFWCLISYCSEICNLKVVNYFGKKLHLSRLIGFWICHCTQ